MGSEKSLEERFRIISESELPSYPEKLTHKEAYNIPLQNLNDYSIIGSGETEGLRFNKLSSKYKRAWGDYEREPFTSFIRLYRERNRDSIGYSNTGSIKIIASVTEDFINGFLLYYELLHRYSDVIAPYPTFEIVNVEGSIVERIPTAVPRILGERRFLRMCDISKLNKTLFTTPLRNTNVASRSAINNWLFNSLFPELQTEITDYIPIYFMSVSTKYYKMYAVQLSLESKAGLQKRIEEISRRCKANYSVDRIVELLRLDQDKTIVTIVTNVFVDSIFNLDFFRYLLDKYYGTIIREIDIINALMHGQITTSETSKIGVKQGIENLIIELLNNPLYNFSGSDISYLFITASYALASMLFETGRVDPADLNIIIPRLLRLKKDLSIGAIEVLFNNSAYDISGYADKIIIYLSNKLEQTELLNSLLHDSRVTSDHIYRVVLDSILYEKPEKVSAFVCDTWYKIDSSSNSIRILLEKFPQIILPLLEIKGILTDKLYTDVFVTPYIDGAINKYAEEFSRSSPNVIRYLLTIPVFDPSYKYNIVARTLIKNNHIDALRDLLRNPRLNLGSGTRKAILENPLLQHLLDDSTE
jgi:hypothetical protein